MEKRRKFNLKKIIVPIIIILVSILTELFLSNYKIITLETSQKGNHIVDSRNIKIEEKVVDDEKIYDIKIDNIDSYAKKIVIKYSAKENGTFSLTYKYYDEYDNLNSMDDIQTMLKDLDEITINLNQKVSSITINSVDIENIHITDVVYSNDYSFSIYRCLFVLVTLILCYAIFMYKNQAIEQLHKVTFLIIILVGLLFIVAAPRIANQTFDEQIHLNKAYTNSYLSTAVYSEAFYYVTEPPGITLPKSQESNEKLNEFLNSNEMKSATYEDKSKLVQYNEIPYLIMSIGIRIGNTFGLPFTIVLCIGKLMNLVSYAFLASFAVKRAVSGKKIVFVLALLPATIYAATHFSLDAIVCGGILLSIVTFIQLYKEKDKKLTVKDIAVFSFPLIIACLAKAIYAPVMLLLLFLPKEKFKDTKQSRLFKMSICFMFIMMMGSFLLPMISGGIAADARGGNTSVSGQLALIFKHPIGFIQMFLNNIYITIYNFLFTYRMYNDFAYIASPNQIYTMLYLIILLYVSFVSGKELSIIKLKERIVIFLGVIVITCMIYGSMYLSFTEVGDTVIKGVQARYFIPLLLPLILVLTPRNAIIEYNENKQMTIINYLLLGILLCGLYGSIIKVFCL